MIAKYLSHRMLVLSGLILTIFCFLTIPYGTAFGACNSVDIRVNAGDDDAEERLSDGLMDLSSTDLELINDDPDDGDQLVGMRFQNVLVPEDATITNAYIEFETDAINRNTPEASLTFYGEAEDDPLTFLGTARNITNRTTTSASVDWNPPLWDTVDEKHRTNNLSTIVQEIVDRGGWANGNAMVFIVEGEGRREAESFNGESGAAPLLHIKYCEAGTPTTIVSFQQNVNSYTGTVDTYLRAGQPAADNSGSPTLVVDESEERHVLLRFEDIFGTGGGQIPPFSTIIYAQLEMNVSNASNAGANLHRMLQTWNDTDTWNTWNGGIDANDTEAASVADSSSSGSGLGLVTIDVTQSLQQWSDDTSGNHGWAWLQPANNDSWQFDSSEGTTPPKLTVIYEPGPTSAPDAPTDLEATTAYPYLPILLTWSDNADNESSYEIERSTDGISFTLLATVEEDITEYLDSDVEPATKYYYRVRAVNPVDPSGYSNEDNATTFAVSSIEICEDFNGYTTGLSIGSHPDWFAGGGGPLLTADLGVASTVGLGPADEIFTWIAHSFEWSAADFSGISFKMDFQTNGSGQFDDDRVGWMITNDSTNSDFIFGVQLDNNSSHNRMEGYWDHQIGVTGQKDIRVEMADLDSLLVANSWYRLYAKFTNLTDTSARIDGELWSLDVNGDPVSMVASGTIDDTSTLGNDSPDVTYFGGTLFPAYKNYSGGQYADNACYEILNAIVPNDCAGDFNGDGDVDGDDLYKIAAGIETLGLDLFGPEYGRTNCLE